MKETEEIVLEEVDIDDIAYNEKTLSEWQDELTVKIPALPCEARLMQQSIIDIANKYQIAYNAFGILYIVCDKAENMFKAEKYKLVGEYLAECKTRNVKPPSKESVEAIVINKDSNKRVRALLDRYQGYEMIKEFFEQHKTKLEKTMTVVREILYSVNGSNRVEHKGNL
jgi:hypothetical protein